MRLSRTQAQNERDVAHRRDLERLAADGDKHAQYRLRENARRRDVDQRRREAAAKGDRDALQALERKAAEKRRDGYKRRAAQKASRESGNPEEIARYKKKLVTEAARMRAKRAEKRKDRLAPQDKEDTDDSITSEDISEHQAGFLDEVAAKTVRDDSGGTLRPRAGHSKYGFDLSSLESDDDIDASQEDTATGDGNKKEEEPEIKEERQAHEIIDLSGNDEKPAQLASHTAIDTQSSMSDTRPVSEGRARSEQGQGHVPSTTSQAQHARRKREIELKLQQARKNARAAALELELLQFGDDE